MSGTTRIGLPTPKSNLEEGLRKGHVLRREGRHDQAIALLKDLLKHYPNSGKVQYALSLSFRFLGDYKSSIECCNNALSRQPNNLIILKARIDTAAALHRSDDLYSFLLDACQRHPKHTPFTIRRASELRKRGQVEESLALLRSLQVLHPSNGDIIFELASTLSAMGGYEEAVATIRSTSQVRDARIALLYINSLMRLHQYAEALSHANEFLANGVHNTSIELRQGQLLRELGRHDDSISKLSRLAQRHPNNTHILFHLSHSYRAARDNAACLALLDRILQADPFHQSALSSRAEVLHLMGNDNELLRFMRYCALQLNTVRTHTERITYANLVCRNIFRISDQEAAAILHSISDVLASVASGLDAHSLWLAYHKADILGLGGKYACFVKALFHGKAIHLQTARLILRSCYSAGLSNWRAVGNYLAHHVPPEQKNLLLMEQEALNGYPRHALTLRKSRPTKIDAAYVLQISALLRQMGRVRLAARYMALAYRHFGENVAVLKEYIACLAGSGKGLRAQEVLIGAESSRPLPSAAWTNVLASGWAEVDQPDRGWHMLQEAGIEPPTYRDWHIITALTIAPKNQVRQLAHHLSDKIGKSTSHLAPTVQGAILTETLRYHDANLNDHHLTITAIKIISRWMEQQPPIGIDGPPSPEIPRTIVQFWSQGSPPTQVMEAIESWRLSPDLHHTLFDRRRARTFLRNHLGDDWARAFNHTGSPTAESDFFRLCYIGVNGGIYADCDDWLIGDALKLIGPHTCLTAFREPTGAIGNNIIIAPPQHPAIIWAALSAKRALERGDGESVWSKLGPGLLTRAIAWFVSHSKTPLSSTLRLLPRWQLGCNVQFHSPLSYKSGQSYWNNHGTAGSLHQISELQNPLD